jgi:hypothetical protein
VVQVNNAGSGGLVFYLDNYDFANPEKWVRVIVNYRIADGEGNPNNLTVGGFNVWTAAPDSVETSEPIWVDAGEPVGYIDQGDGWAIAAFDFIIQPNPEEEWIEIVFGYQTESYFFPAENGDVFIDEVQINTRCVPIPGAVWLLGSGLVTLVGLRRKFRK